MLVLAPPLAWSLAAIDLQVPDGRAARARSDVDGEQRVELASVCVERGGVRSRRRPPIPHRLAARGAGRAVAPGFVGRLRVIAGDAAGGVADHLGVREVVVVQRRQGRPVEHDQARCPVVAVHGDVVRRASLGREGHPARHARSAVVVRRCPHERVRHRRRPIRAGVDRKERVEVAAGGVEHHRSACGRRPAIPVATCHQRSPTWSRSPGSRVAKALSPSHLPESPRSSRPRSRCRWAAPAAPTS